MFGFRKRKPTAPERAPAASNRFHILLLSGSAAASKLMEPILGLSESDMERTALVVDEDGGGGMVVTCDDPSPLKARYISLGFKVGLASIPRRRPNENAHMVSMDLRMTGEYQQLRKDWLSG
jgi:hypothetical protein